ncbi:MAG: M1 family metallopeptidase [Saprospiraceae bacterium]|nr:M1 family metallopeptidase [Saprospiraceae bacterium]
MPLIKFSQFALLAAIVFFGCSSPKMLVPEPLPMASADMDSTEIRDLDTLVVKSNQEDEADSLPSEQAVYHATATRSFDLLHTKLDLHFDWSTESVLGSAELTLTPFFYPDSILYLNAIDFDIKKLEVDHHAVQYQYDGDSLEIHLDKRYRHGEKFTVTIDYHATPTRGSDGSAAITSDQGLFFINADLTDPDKPQQIWSQGETEFNSRWFPTIDKPNERSTEEIFLTVEDRFKTLSNGLLESSKDNGDGTRTDHWVMDMPHAPYLFMIAIGDFAKIDDTWNGKPLAYYVEPEFAEDAKDIFAHTPEMLSFFSEKTGVNYPWPKFSQIIVRDYVSGAMENTTAVIFGEFIQKHKRELIDNNNDAIVAHEMFHHWFGDYVTCESWSNLTLNEGFANYAEYLWLEHKYGRDEAENHRIEEIQGYLYQASQEVHPLIDFAYRDKENMFDAHSYNKGGLVLHMLRNLVGDDAFFASLNRYLTTHAFNSVEVHDLRLAFEDVTGMDLNWFFNQWYLDEGHPILDYNYSYSATDQEIEIHVDQKQDAEMPLFVIPTEVEVLFANGQRKRIPIKIDSREEKIRIPATQEPALVILDPDRSTLAIINEEYTTAQYRLMYAPENSLSIRTLAVSKLAADDEEASQAILAKAIHDPFWAVRRAALSSYDWQKHSDNTGMLAELAEKDPNSMVKADAIYLLGTLGDKSYEDAVVKGINNEDPYPVVAASILALKELDPDLALEKLKMLESEEQSDIVASVSMIYGESGDTSKLGYFEKHLSSVEGLPSLDFYQSLEGLLRNTSANTKMMWMDKFEKVATGDAGISPYTKIAATRSMISLLKSAEQKKSLLSESQLTELRLKIEGIIDQETNPQIISIYQSFMSS